MKNLEIDDKPPSTESAINVDKHEMNHEMRKKSSEQMKGELLGFVQYLPSRFDAQDESKVKLFKSAIVEFASTGEFPREKVSEADFELLLDYFRDYTAVMREHYSDSRRLVEEKESVVEYPEAEIILRKQVINTVEKIDNLVSSFSADIVNSVDGVKELEVKNLIANIRHLFEKKFTNEDYETIFSSSKEIERQIEIINKQLVKIEQIEQLINGEQQKQNEVSVSLGRLIQDEEQQRSERGSRPWFKKFLSKLTGPNKKNEEAFFLNKRNKFVKEMEKNEKSLDKNKNELLICIKELVEIFDFFEKMLAEVKKTPPVFKHPPREGEKLSLDDMAVVRCDSYEPSLGQKNDLIIKAVVNKENSYLARNTIHTTINGIVPSHFGGSWSGSPIIYLMPMSGVVEKNGPPAVYYAGDTYWMGDLKIPKDSIMWVTKGHYMMNLPQQVLSDIKIIVSDEPYLDISTYLKKNNLMSGDRSGLNEEAQEKVFGIDGKRGGSAYSHHHSPTTQFEFLSLDTFNFVDSQKRLKDVDEDYVMLYSGVVHRTVEAFRILYGNQAEAKFADGVEERGLTMEKLKREYLNPVPVAEMLKALEKNFDEVISKFEFFCEEKIKRNKFGQIIWGMDDHFYWEWVKSKENCVRNIGDMARMLNDNYNDLIKYVPIDREIIESLLKKVSQYIV